MFETVLGLAVIRSRLTRFGRSLHILHRGWNLAGSRFRATNVWLIISNDFEIAVISYGLKFTDCTGAKHGSISCRNYIATQDSDFGCVIKFWSYYESVSFTKLILGFHVDSRHSVSIPNSSCDKVGRFVIIETTITAFLSLVDILGLIIELFCWIVSL